MAEPTRPGGTKAVMVETLLIKHQLLVMSRSHRRAPRFSPLDRVLFGLFFFANESAAVFDF